MKYDAGYAIRLLKHALRIDQGIVKEYGHGKTKYLRSAVRLSKSRIPSLKKAIKQLESKKVKEKV